MDLKIFGLGSSRNFAASVAGGLGVGLAEVNEVFRLDGEPWAASVDNVRGRDVFVVSSLHGDEGRSVNDRVMQLLLFVNALKHASAARITAVCPYLAYMRQDRKEGSREPISTQALAVMMEGVGVDRVLTMDVHNPAAIQNAFRIPVDILEAKNLLADLVAADASRIYAVDEHPLVVVSPDAGGVKRARAFREAIARRLGRGVGFAHANKTRSREGDVEVTEIVGDVRGVRCILIDDMIATGGTLIEIDRAIRPKGITVAVAATHGLFLSAGFYRFLSEVKTYVADTIDPWGCLPISAKPYVKVAKTAGLFAEAIRRIHSGEGSISELLEDR